MILNKTGYGYNDLTIIPSEISEISSRSECNPFVDGNLPIFASPMSTITNEQNISIWKQNHITPIVPRNIDLSIRANKFMRYGEWVALSLKEFKTLWCNISELDAEAASLKDKTFRVCVDLANGHMKSLYETINQAKELSHKFGYNLIIMTGNIANPETYEWICRNAEVDYIRLSIGSGANCITATQSSIYYPIATLIDECYKIKCKILPTSKDQHDCFGITTPYHSEIDVRDNFNCIKYKSKPYIVADGGVRGYADVIKALGLGADYVMIGSVFTKLFESAGPLVLNRFVTDFDDKTGTVTLDAVEESINIWDINTSEENKRNIINCFGPFSKESYGMSTKKAQQLINPNAKTKTSEGCYKTVEVKETIYQWTDNMISYLKSAMSYTNKRVLSQFIGKVDMIVNSNSSIMSVNK